MTTVFVEGLELYGYHGFSDEEQTLGHRYRVDVTANLHDGFGLSDDLAQTVDYGAICGLVAREFVEPCRLVEALAHRIGKALLSEFELVQSVEVCISKLMPPAPFVVAACGVIANTKRTVSEENLS